MTAQFLDIAGVKMAVIPVVDYERLLELAEEQSDIDAAIRADERRKAGEEYVPADIVYRIMDGENALKVWRKYRGMTIDALAAASDVRASMISMLENGKAQGKPGHWRALATALNTNIEDILPED